MFIFFQASYANQIQEYTLGWRIMVKFTQQKQNAKNASFDLEFRWIWVPNFWRPHPLIHEEKGAVTS